MNSTPRQLNAWAEIIQRRELLRDAQIAKAMRIAHHADRKGWNEWFKKQIERGQ